MSEGLEDLVLAHPRSAQPLMVPLAVGLPAPPHRRTSGPAAGTRRHPPEEKYGKCQRRKGTGSGPGRGFLRRKGGGSCAGRVQEGSRKGSRKGGSCAGRGGVPVQEGSRKGLGRGPGRGVPVQEGGGFLCRKGVPGGFLGWFLCRKGGGFLYRMGVPGGFLGQFLCRKGGGGFLSDMHMPQPTHGAQLKPSNSPPLALPLPLTLGKQY